MDETRNRSKPANAIQQVHKRVSDAEARVKKIEEQQLLSRQELQELMGQINEMLEFFGAMKGAFRVLNWLGKLAKPVAAIVALGVALASAWAARGGRSL